MQHPLQLLLPLWLVLSFPIFVVLRIHRNRTQSSGSNPPCGCPEFDHLGHWWLTNHNVQGFIKLYRWHIRILNLDIGTFLRVALHSSLFIYGEVILRFCTDHSSWRQPDPPGRVATSHFSVLIIVVDGDGLAKVAKQRTTAMDLGSYSRTVLHQSAGGGSYSEEGIHSGK